jgi:WD40 repeat protein
MSILDSSSMAIIPEIWKVSSGNLIRILTGHSDVVYSVTFS